MPYIVDGHNLLGQIPGLSLEDPGDRRRLVALLTAFARTRRCSMTVLFDGEPPAGWKPDMHFGRVRVLHSGRGKSADDAILDSIRRARAPADITIVTSDRRLYERGRHLGARAMQGRAFREMLALESRRGAGAGEKPERPDPSELDYFMRAFGASVPPEPPAAEPDPGAPAKPPRPSRPRGGGRPGKP